MSLFEVFQQQGLAGILGPGLFVVLMVTGIVAGAVRTKTAGYAFMAGAWVAGALFTVQVARNLLALSGFEPGAAQAQMLAASLCALAFFLQTAFVLSTLGVGVLAVTKFNRRHLAVEALAVATLLLMHLALRWAQQSMQAMAG